MKGEQLALAVGLTPPQTFAMFWPGPNREVVQTLKALLEPKAGLGLYLHGGAGSGKSHLLAALAAEAALDGLPTAILSLQGDDPPPSARLWLLDMLDTTALDDAAELKLIRFLDAVNSNGINLLMTARIAPHSLPVQRPDLRSRLLHCASFGLRPLSDDDRLQWLQVQGHARGLQVPDEVARFLLKCLPRDAGSLSRAIEQLDHGSLAAHRRLTVPFVSNLLLGPKSA